MADESLTKQAARIAQRLEAVPAEILRSLGPALLASANATASVAKALAPEDEGDLKDSIIVTGPGETTPAYTAGGGTKTAGENQVFVTVGNPKVRHAHLAEFGTKPHVNGGIFEGTLHPGTAPQPFILPADRLTRESNRRRIARAVSRAVRLAAQGRKS